MEVDFQFRDSLMSLHSGPDDAPSPPGGLSPFDLLPNHLMELIFEKFGVSDRVRLRSVCKGWNTMLRCEDIPVAVEPPWLILPLSSTETTDERHEICFRSFEDQTYRFRIPFKGRWSFCGSSRGWLIIGGWSEEQWQSGHCDLLSAMLQLWNPLSGRHATLPALSTLPFYNWIVSQGTSMGHNSITVYILRIEVFSKGNIECVAAILSNPVLSETFDSQLAVCTPSDHCWTPVVPPHGLPPKDVLFHAGTLCVIFCKDDDNPNATTAGQRIGREGSLVIPLGACEVEISLLTLFRNVPVRDGGQELFMGLNYVKGANFIEELGESSTGELLLVSSIIDWYSYDNGNFLNRGLMQRFESTQTSGYEVHRVRLAEGRLERLNDLGPQAIFVGGWNGPIVISLKGKITAEDVAADIYFSTTNDERTILEPADEAGNWRVRHYGVFEQGVFSLRHNRKLVCSSKDVEVESEFFAGWFMPKLF